MQRPLDVRKWRKFASANLGGIGGYTAPILN
jgi:hypothetical protein